MHSFRLRYVALGLLIYIQSAFSDTSCDESDFTDVASRTVQASIVFEGRPARLIEVAGPTGGEGKVFLVQFRVRRVFKDRSSNRRGVAAVSGGESADGGEQTAQFSVVVGPFGGASPSVAEEEGEETRGTSCVAPVDAIDLKSRTSYVVFLDGNCRTLGGNKMADDNRLTSCTFQNNNNSNRSNDNNNNNNYYTISGAPENVTSQAVKEIKSYSVAKFATAPVVRLPVQQLQLTLGKKMQLNCKIQRGRPTPVVRWFKDGQPLLHSKHAALKSNRRGLTLVIRKAKADDAGIYQCLAVNVVGSATSPNVTVTLTSETPKVPWKKCSKKHRDYCLSGGTCHVLSSLVAANETDNLFCRCLTGFTGNRCQEKFTSHSSQFDKKRRLKRMHGSHS